MDGHTRVCGLIGNPVEHTLSPLIHNHLAEKMGENLVYVPFLVAPENVEDAVKGAWALNLLGCNVTVPYKTDVFRCLEEIDPLARRIGGVNTLVRTEGGFKGYNTDMPGLYRAFVHDGVKVSGEETLILGAGGVARAVAFLLEEKGASRIVILNRTVERAEAIAAEVNAYAGRKLAEALPLNAYGTLTAGDGGTNRFLAIQTTSVGMHPKVQDVLIEEPQFYEMIHTGYDLIYNPAETSFMKEASKYGKKAFNGAGMLLYQGIIAYELWTGTRVEDSLAEEVAVKMTEALKQRG